jgi:hypothetical protein
LSTNINRLKRVRFAFIFLNSSAVLAWIINTYTDGNYMIDYLGSYNILVLGTVAFFLFSVLFYFLSMEKESKDNKKDCFLVGKKQSFYLIND